jgi:hypothetical protein
MPGRHCVAEFFSTWIKAPLKRRDRAGSALRSGLRPPRALAGRTSWEGG